jgi:hypothetical protein
LGVQCRLFHVIFKSHCPLVASLIDSGGTGGVLKARSRLMRGLLAQGRVGKALGT